MKALQTWLLCLLLLCLALKGAAGQAHQHSMEIRSECPGHPDLASLTCYHCSPD